jgi:hypothetical protein
MTKVAAYLGFATLFSIGLLHAQSSCLVAPPGLVSWWSGDNNTNDLLGGNNPSLVTTVTIAPAEVGAGLQYGTLGQIDIPAAANLANQRFTWSSWVRPDGPGPNTDGSVILQQNQSATAAVINVLWRPTDGRFLFEFGDLPAELITSSHTFPTGSFYLVTVTYDGVAFRLYVNGAVEGTFASTKTVLYNSRVWTIGTADPAYIGIGYPRTWNGVIDEVQAYARALTAAEIQALFNAGSSGVCKGLILTPRSMVFPDQPVGTPSPHKPVRVASVSTTTVNFTSAKTTGDFSIVGTTCTGWVVAPGATCYIALQFTPAATGTRSGYLVVQSNGAGNPLYVKLSGTGL